VSALDDLVQEDGTIYRRGKPVCDANAARAELAALRRERDALREAMCDLLFRLEEAGDDERMTILAQARAALRGEGKA